MYLDIMHKGKLMARIERTGFGNRYRPTKWMLQIRGESMPRFLNSQAEALATAQAKFPGAQVLKFNSRAELIWSVG